MDAERPTSEQPSTERLTVPALLRRRVADAPDTRFVVSADGALTYTDLDRASRRLAAQLIADGVGKGSRVGLLMGNGLAWPTLAFAVMRIGGVVVPLSTLLAPPELAANLRAAGVEHLLCSSRTRTRDHLADLAAIAPGLVPGISIREPTLPRLRSIRVCDSTATTADYPADPPAAAVEMVRAFEELVRPADDMVIIFTSGSRGAPKAVVHTHGGALGAVEASLGPRCITANDRIYIPMPFFWMGGFGGGLITAFVAGATLVTDAGGQPEQTLRLLERERVTLFRGWPDQAAALASHPAFDQADLTSLKPGSLDPVLPENLRARPGERPVLFGMTETFGPYCADPLDGVLPRDKQGSLGRPFSGVDIRIARSETAPGQPSESLAVGEVGQILVRGPNIMRSICGRTREETLTADGYYPTGDAGRLDADGYLWFAGRLDDMFKVQGATVYPSEVEEALQQLPYVARAFAVDVIADGATRVGAAVVIAGDPAGVESSPSGLEARLVADARTRLSAFKVPARWRIVEAHAIPRTSTDKVDKDALRRLIETAAEVS